MKNSVEDREISKTREETSGRKQTRDRRDDESYHMRHEPRGRTYDHRYPTRYQPRGRKYHPYHRREVSRNNLDHASSYKKSGFDKHKSSDRVEINKLKEGTIDYDSELEEGEVDQRGHNEKFEVRIMSMREAFESVSTSDLEEAFDDVCDRLKISLDSLWALVLENSSSDTNELIRVAYGALSTIIKMFRSISPNKQEQRKHSLSRLLCHVAGQIPPLFSYEKTEEFKIIKKSLKSGSPSLILEDMGKQVETGHLAEATEQKKIEIDDVSSIISSEDRGRLGEANKQSKVENDKDEGSPRSQDVHSYIPADQREDSFTYYDSADAGKKTSASSVGTPAQEASTGNFQFKPRDPRRARHIKASFATCAPSIINPQGPHFHPSQDILKPENERLIISSPLEAYAAPCSSQNAFGDAENISATLELDEEQKVVFYQERARRIDEQKKMFAVRKLCLVLDLDHTLLNSAKFSEVDPMHEKILKKREEREQINPQRELFRIPQMKIWTKLRPGIWNFLEKASKLFELHVCTMGSKRYATEMAKLLDHEGTLFCGRVISRGSYAKSADISASKDLEGVLGMESCIVIIDDTPQVWPQHKMNLIVIERYLYFPCAQKQFGRSGPSLLESDRDESQEAGSLASCLAVIERIHENFFAQPFLEKADTRKILASEKKKILSGCRILFSQVIPLEADPHSHRLWQKAEQFGATCTDQIDDEVTHVVSSSVSSHKVKWACSARKFVVNPGWLEASAYLYRRARERDFAVIP